MAIKASFDLNSIGVVPPDPTRIHHRSKRLFFGLYVIALPLGTLYATSLAPASASNYACAPGQGTVHPASDLAPHGDLRNHQTDDGFTCYLASKPSVSCTSPSVLHQAKDLTGGVLPEHQVGQLDKPQETCIEGNLPLCAPGLVTLNQHTGKRGDPMTPEDICVAK
jgi:hypothetical protein